MSLEVVLNGMSDPGWFEIVQSIWCAAMDLFGVHQSYC